MKQFFTLFLTITLLIALFNQCSPEAEDVLPQQEDQKGYITTIDPQQEPELMESIENLLMQANGRSANLDHIDWSKAIKVANPGTGQDYYTFGFIRKNSIETVIENLIYAPANESHKLYYLSYIADRQWLMESDLDLISFSGVVKGTDVDGTLISQAIVKNGRVIIDGNFSGRIMTDVPPFPNSPGCYDLLYSTATGNYFWAEKPCDGGSGGSGSGSGGGGDTSGGSWEDTSGDGRDHDGTGGGDTWYEGDGSSGGSSGGSGSTGDSYDESKDGKYAGVLPSVEDFFAAQLETLLEEDPFALIDIDCDQIAQWLALAQHEASDAIKDKINQLQDSNDSWFDDWAIQTLNGAEGTIVNMDYFSVNVSKLPNHPDTKLPFTPEGFLDYFRRNINDFTEGSTFAPYCETQTLCTQETALWYSKDPTGALIYIDIPGDDGVVVCSEYTTTYWNFMTLEAPGAGNHPVSGTRQFGFESNGTGGYSFFVRGVDRFNSNIQENASYIRFGGDPFSPADDLWVSFQNKLDEFIKSNDGISDVNEPVKNRPDWEEIDQVLSGEKPVSGLGCN